MWETEDGREPGRKNIGVAVSSQNYMIMMKGQFFDSEKAQFEARRQLPLLFSLREKLEAWDDSWKEWEIGVNALSEV